MLPQPYPDELVGSILIRGSIWTGLAFERLIKYITSENVTSHSMFTTSHAAIARECALTPLELLQRHTLVPYAVSFLPEADREQRMLTFALFDHRRDFGALAQKLLRNSRQLKFCPGCVKDDLQRFGESYWHRVHQLDGYLYCPHHSASLHVTTVHVRTRRQLLPHEAGSIGQQIIVNAQVERVAQLSAGVSDALNWEHILPTDLQGAYFEQSACCGYQISRRRIAGAVFSGDLRDFYGEQLLNLVGCQVDATQTVAWPARMLRRNPRQFTPIRHVLLRQFFQNHPSPSVDLYGRLHAPRPRSLDYSYIDRRALAKMLEVVQTCAQQGKVALVEDLLKEAGIASLIKHKRSQLPMVDAFIRAQRLTNRRKRWSKQS